MEKYSPGDVVEGKVVSLKSYGAFVALESDVIGLLHISEVADGFIEDINNYINIGESIIVKILDIDYEQKKAKLSRKVLNKRIKYKKRGVNFADEKIQSKNEFKDILEKQDEFINKAKIRFEIND